MIFGTCPYEDCDGSLWLPAEPEGVKYERHECETCHRVIWTRYSRLDPWSMTEAEFLAAYEVDEATRTIQPKSGAA